MLAARAAGGDFLVMAAEVAVEGVGVGVESHGEVAIGAEGLPTTFVTECERGRTAAVVKDEGLTFGLEVVLDIGEEGCGEVVVFGEIVVFLEVDESDFGLGRGRFGFLAELDKSLLRFSEVIINNIGCGGAKDAGNLALGSNEAGETEGRVARGILLIISAFVCLVDDDETEVVNWRE